MRWRGVEVGRGVVESDKQNNLSRHLPQLDSSVA